MQLTFTTVSLQFYFYMTKVTGNQFVSNLPLFEDFPGSDFIDWLNCVGEFLEVYHVMLLLPKNCLVFWKRQPCVSLADVTLLVGVHKYLLNFWFKRMEDCYIRVSQIARFYWSTNYFVALNVNMISKTKLSIKYILSYNCFENHSLNDILNNKWIFFEGYLWRILTGNFRLCHFIPFSFGWTYYYVAWRQILL